MTAPSALRHPDRSGSADLLTQAREWAAPSPAGDRPTTSWTWDAIRRAARIARSRTSISAALAREADLTDVALSGVSLAVVLNPEITPRDAIWAGAREIQNSFGATKHHHGLKSTGPMPSYATYWLDRSAPIGTPTQCEERLATIAVFNALPPMHQQTLVALASTGSMRDAAEAVGVGIETFKWRAKSARRAALRLWFDEETPPPLTRLRSHRRGRGRTCPSGHLIVGDNAMATRSRGRMGERCRTCHDKTAGGRVRREATS